MGKLRLTTVSSMPHGCDFSVSDAGGLSFIRHITLKRIIGGTISSFQGGDG